MKQSKKLSRVQKDKDYIIKALSDCVDRLEKKFGVQITYNIDFILFLKRK